MAKAKDAFRTISEVAEWLDTPTHVLRFWESKFSQIKPVKGAGGRRYYRPADMDLLGGIKQLLHEDGLTIKGTQKLLREKGVKYVAGLGHSMTQDVPAQPAPEQTSLVPDTPEPVAAPAPPKPAAAGDLFQNSLPFDDSTTLDLPDAPADVTDLPARLIGRAPLDASRLQAHAARIAPLLTRLETVRARMAG